MTICVEGVAVKEEWKGTNLTSLMVEFGIVRATLQGYSQGYVFPLTSITSLPYRKDSRWTKLAEIDAKNFDMGGLRPFEQVE